MYADRDRQWRWTIDSYIEKYTLLYFIVYPHEVNNLQQCYLCKYYHLTLSVHFISVIFHCLLMKLTDK